MKKTMKWMTLSLSAAALLGLTACGAKPAPAPTASPEPTQIPAVQPAELDDLEGVLTAMEEEPSNSKQPQNKRGRLHAFLNVIQKNRTFLYIVLIIAFIAMSKFLLDSTVQVGTTAAMNSYLSTFESEKESTYQTLFQYYYDEAKNKYLVSNRVGISVGDMKETANLEVLKVSDVEYIIEDQKDGITSWLEVPGEGTYIVNLQAAEFVIDNDNSYVLVRAPHPELANITIDYENVNKLLFKNDMLNESFKYGENLAQSQLNAANALIRKELAANQNFYLNAEDAAVRTIQCLVKRFNPGIDMNRIFHCAPINPKPLWLRLFCAKLSP